MPDGSPKNPDIEKLVSKLIYSIDSFQIERQP